MGEGCCIVLSYIFCFAENPFDIEKAKNRSGVFGDLSLVALERRVATLEVILHLHTHIYVMPESFLM